MFTHQFVLVTLLEFSWTLDNKTIIRGDLIVFLKLIKQTEMMLPQKDE